MAGWIMKKIPEPKSTTEPLDLERKIADTLSGKRPFERLYPYFEPDYELEFLHIGTEKQLFLDNFILDHVDGVHRVLCRPVKHERPLLEWSDLPWEQAGFSPGVTAALRDPDDGRFKMWYWQTLTGDPFNQGQVLCYAESDDGLSWRKPLSEQCLPYREHKATNIVHRDVAASGLVLNHDRSDPQRKFLLLYCPYADAKEKKGGGILSRVAASADGLRWTVISEDVPQRHQHESRIIWDEAIQAYVAYSQYSHHWHYRPGRTRKIGRQTSPDFIHWSPKEAVLAVEDDPLLPPDREFHEASVRKVGGLYIAIVGESHMEPLWCVGGVGNNWRDQFHVTLVLYTSRDGRRFHRAHGLEPWVDNGPPGSRDYGFCSFTCAGTLEHEGRTIVTYNTNPYKQTWFEHDPPPHTIVPSEEYKRQKALWDLRKSLGNGPRRRSVGGLILREDGWAKLEPVREQGIALTRQFVFEGDTLEINAQCDHGFIRVELLDPRLEPYPGFGEDACDPIHGPAHRVWHAVTWRGNGDVRSLWNRPVRIRFELHQASLFAFQFVNRKP